MSVLKPKRNESSIEYIRLANGRRPAYRRAARKIRAFKRMVDCGQMEYEDVYCSMNSIISYFDNFNDNNRSFRLKRLFKNTFGFEYNDLSTFRRRDFYNV